MSFTLVPGEIQMSHMREYRSSVPRSKRAGVLVLLYEKNNVLRVLLTTRAKTLRTHPGQTALPGGKMDETDEDIIETAVCLPLHFTQIAWYLIDDNLRLSTEKPSRRLHFH